MKLGFSIFTDSELEALKLLIAREENRPNTIYAQVLEAEQIAIRERYLLERISVLEEKMAKLEAKEDNGITGRRVGGERRFCHDRRSCSCGGRRRTVIDRRGL